MINSIRENLFSYYWGIALIFVSFSIPNMPGFDVRETSAALLFIFGSISFLIFRKNISDKYYKYLLLGVAFCIPVNLEIMLAANGEKNWFLVSPELYQFLAVVFGVYMIGHLSSNYTEKTGGILKGFLFACVTFQSSWVVLQKFGFNMESLWGVKTSGRVIDGSLCNRMITATYLGALAPFVMNFKSYPILKIPIFLIYVYAVYLMDSAMGYFGISTTVSSYLYIKSKSNIMPITALVLFGSYYFYNPGFFSLSGRGELWTHGLGLIVKNPLGMKMGWVYDGFIKVGPVTHGNMHSEYLSGLAYFGIPGAILIFIYIFRNCKDAAKREGNTIFLVSIASFAAVSFGAFPLHIAPTALIFLLTFSFLIYNKEELK